MPNSAPATTTFLGDGQDDAKSKPSPKSAFVPGPEFYTEAGPALGKYLEPEKVNVVLVRNCGILLEEPDETSAELDARGRKSVRKKDSMYQNKIPVEIRRNARSQLSKKGWRKFGGIIFGVLSSLCFSLTLLIAKILRDQHDHHPICITVWRYIGILAPAIPISIFYHCCTSEPVFDSVWPINNAKNLRHCSVYIMQGICGCTAIIFRFYSLEFISLADATVVSFSSPVFVTILAHFFLGEKCSVVSFLVAILTCLGVVVIARPPMLTEVLSGGQGGQGDPKLWIGVMLAVASMACASGLLILLRNIRATHFSLMLLVSGGWGVGQSAVMGWSLSVLKVPSTVEAGSLVALLCVLTFFGQMGIILALKYENAGPVAVFRSSEVLFAFLWQLQFFGEWPDIYSVVGASIIIIAVVVIATRSWVAGLTPDNVHRKRLLILTK